MANNRRLVAVLVLAGLACASCQNALTGAGPAGGALLQPAGTAVPAGGAGPAGAAAAGPAGPCALGLTFFPPQGKNMPQGWTQEAQASGGNPNADQITKIALAGYPIPQLYMAPISVFTNVGGSVPLSCLGSAAPGEGILARPAAFTLSWKMGAAGAQIGPFTKGSKQDPPGNVTLAFVPQLPDGDYCVDVSLDLIPGTGIVTVGSQQVAAPAAAQSIKRRVCFYKLATRPRANITFHSCNDSFAVDLSGIKPAPQLLGPGQALFSPVFHVWGELNRTFTNNVPAGNLLRSFSQYVRWDDPADPPFLRVFMETPGLIEGYYTVNIEGSLATSVPDIVSLFGLDQFEDGSAKYMGVSLRNASNRPVPIQTTKSKIADLAGPDVPTNGQAQFSWETQGYGEQFCYVDGQRISNSRDRVHCESPLTLAVTGDQNHTLTITLTDVCGETVQSGLFFGGWGWRPDLRYSPPAPPPPAPDVTYNNAPAMAMPIGVGGANRTRSAAGRASSSSSVLLAVAVAGAGALAAALL